MLHRHRLIASFLTTSFALGAGVECRASITIETVPIGNAGNASDPADGDANTPGTQNFGAVAYNYRIGKYDVTVGQYTAFLNAVAATDRYLLYDPTMALDLNVAGISRNGVQGGYSYSVIGSPNHPITYVSWGDAARFANWLSNGQPTGAQGQGTTETGAYTLNGALSDEALNAVTRNAGAKWFIPSESEWYKAAYYDPVAAHYWTYTTGTNTPLTSAPPGSIPNTANFYDVTTGYAVTGSRFLSKNPNYLTDVGAYTASASPYGTFDQGGDVLQWNEALRGFYRSLRGGAWIFTSEGLSSFRPSYESPGLGVSFIGFRVASIPEPSTAALLVIGCVVALVARRR
jgi:sulfatase modifying factor 1